MEGNQAQSVCKLEGYIDLKGTQVQILYKLREYKFRKLNTFRTSVLSYYSRQYSNIEWKAYPRRIYILRVNTLCQGVALWRQTQGIIGLSPLSQC